MAPMSMDIKITSWNIVMRHVEHMGNLIVKSELILIDSCAVIVSKTRKVGRV